MSISAEADTEEEKSGANVTREGSNALFLDRQMKMP